jgi:hypothetical protein
MVKKEKKIQLNKGKLIGLKVRTDFVVCSFI